MIVFVNFKNKSADRGAKILSYAAKATAIGKIIWRS